MSNNNMCEYSRIDFVDRIFIDPQSCIEYLNGIVDFIKTNVYGDVMQEYVYNLMKQSVETNNSIMMIFVFLIILENEDSVKNSLRLYYKNNENIEMQEFLEKYLFSLKCKSIELRSMPYYGNKSYDYIEKYVDFFKRAWIKRDKHIIKMNSILPNEISSKKTGCDLMR